MPSIRPAGSGVSAGSGVASGRSVGRDRKARRNTPYVSDWYEPHMAADTSVPQLINNGCRYRRWIAPRDGYVYGLAFKVSVSSGNSDFGIYDEELTLLASSGGGATPAVSNTQTVHFAAGGVAVEAGRVYWLAWSCSNTTGALGGWSDDLVATFEMTSRSGSLMYPLPSRVNVLVNGWTPFGETTGVSLVPLMDPPLTAYAPAGELMSGVYEVFAVDSDGRLYGATSGGALCYSDDDGDSWTSTTFNPTGDISAMCVVGDYLLVGADNAGVGGVYRALLSSGLATGDFTQVVTSQEGAARNWNLKGYPDGVVFVGNYYSSGNGADQVRVRKSTDFGETWSTVMDLGASDGSLRHVHSVVRLYDTDPTRVYVNVGDSGSLSGVYKSTNTGASFARVSTFGAIRLTPAEETSDGKVLWASDHYRRGGNLFIMDAGGTYLQPRSLMDAPWYGDIYAMTKDSDGVMWYVPRYTNYSSTDSLSRTCIFATPDDGVSSFLVVDLGQNAGYGTAITRSGNYLFFEQTRYDVSRLSLV